MKRSSSLFGLLCSVVLASGCSNGSEPNPPSGLDCSAVAPLSLVVGGHAVQDAQTACVRFPAASSQGAEYLYVALSTQARLVADEGDSVGFAVQGSTPAVAAVMPMTRAFSRAPRPSNPAAVFHARLLAL
jgi:hypothetical protein